MARVNDGNAEHEVHLMEMLKSVHIEGFKSIRDATIDLGPVNVLIGANGSGKSNFVSFFELMRTCLMLSVHEAVARAGGPGALLHFGPGTTDEIRAVLRFAIDGKEEEWGWRFVQSAGSLVPVTDTSLPGHVTVPESPERPRGVHLLGTEPDSMRFWRTYHFRDTAPTAAIRQQGYIDDNHELRSGAGNLAAYLHMLREKHRPYYDRIIGAFRMAAPWFDDFVLEPLELRPEDVKLDWRERGRDTVFGPHQLSDGSLRTIALLTLLLQPEERLPSLMIIDEPELGLHPYVIAMVADLLRSVSTDCQVIVATQSTNLLNHFAPQEIIVVEREDEQGTVFERLSEDRLSEWLERYSVGELWEKNVLGGRP